MQKSSGELPEAAPSIVTVFVSGDPAAVITAKLILDGEGIRYITEGEGVQDLIGLGRVGGFNPVTGGVQLRVASENVEAALEALQELKEDRAAGA